MTQYEDLIAPRRGWLSRLLAPEANARPAASAFVVGALGAASFVASLALRWHSITIPTDINAPNGMIFIYENGTSSVTSPSTLGQIYALGVIALLSLVGATLNRADLALRLRMGAAGLTVGLLGVVIAITIIVPDLASRQGAVRDGPGAVVSYEPGLLFAYAAVVLPIVAIWLASRPAVREGLWRDTAKRTAQPAADDDNAQLFRGPAWRPDVREPLDLTVTPER
jgi:hypothetical protein